MVRVAASSVFRSSLFDVAGESRSISRPEKGETVVKEDCKPTLQWAEQTLQKLSDESYTGTVTIRFAQGGVQSMTVNQELQPRQHATITQPRPIK